MPRFLFILGCALLAARVSAADTFTGEAAVIARIRAASHAALAAHHAGQAVAWLEPEVNITAGSGTVLSGRDAVRQKLAEQFGQLPDLIYVRTPQHITPSSSLPLAAEQGTWVGRWTEAGQLIELRGNYFAMWRKTNGTWLIRSELFVLLERRENGTLLPAK
jgi:hypothetical protein